MFIRINKTCTHGKTPFPNSICMCYDKGLQSLSIVEYFPHDILDHVFVFLTFDVSDP
jgi:hypothetical protein